MSQIMTLDFGYEIVRQVRGVDYNGAPAKEALSEHQYELVRELLQLPPFDQRSKADVKQEFIGTIDDLALFVSAGIQPTVKRVRGTFIDRSDMPHQESTIAGVMEKFSNGPSIINLTIPNAAMFAVKTLTVMEDCCTNEVQRMLDDGWRIVAVCPPNDTRRPTYILGHMEKK